MIQLTVLNSVLLYAYRTLKNKLAYSRILGDSSASAKIFGTKEGQSIIKACKDTKSTKQGVFLNYDGINSRYGLYR